MSFVIIYQKKGAARRGGPNAISVLGTPDCCPFEEADAAFDFASNQFGWNRWWDIVKIGATKQHPEYEELVYYVPNDLVTALATGHVVFEGEE